jgi:imidazolonepropionase-like amidohydrolase
MKIFLISILLTIVATCNVSFAQSKIKAIKAGKLIDVVNGKVLENQIILIDSIRIIEIGSALTIPQNAEVIDLTKFTVLPGLVDCHTHLTLQPGDNYYEDIFKKTAIDRAIRAPIYAKRTLEAGFTMVRDVGAGSLIDISLRNAINSGEIPGPRMLVSAFDLGATGGHADLTGFNPNIDWKYNKDFTGVADGENELRKRVRNNIKWGADWIKVIATAGVLSEEESAGAPQYSLDELKVVVEEAHRWGRNVAAHAHVRVSNWQYRQVLQASSTEV